MQNGTLCLPWGKQQKDRNAFSCTMAGSQSLGYTARAVLAHSLITENSFSSAAKFMCVQNPTSGSRQKEYKGNLGITGYCINEGINRECNPSIFLWCLVIMSLL